MRTILLVAVVAVTGCGRFSAQRSAPDDGGTCTCSADRAIPSTGEATLSPHTDDQNYLGSVVSFEWATTTDSEEVRNDWDLSLEPSTQETGALAFRVNTVTDDRSCIEDEGQIEFVKVPAQISKCGDFLPVVEGHVYLVHTVDSDTDLYAAFGVIHADANGVTMRWFRSAAADRFALGF